MSTRRGRSLRVLPFLVLCASAPAPAATKRVFVTSATCDGNLGPCSAAVGDSGIAAANNICQELADAAGLTAGGEVFRAWISDTTADAYCNVLGLAGQRFGAPPACGVATLPAAGPWARLDGVPFLDSLDDLDQIGSISTINIDEAGAYPSSPEFFQTGSTSFGTLQAGSFCNGWTDGTFAFTVTGGNTDILGNSWGAGASTNCIGPKRLVCFEVGAGDPLVYPSRAGALAFVSSASGWGDFAGWSWSGGNSGLAGAFAVCGSLAAAASLPFPDSFVPFLSDGAIHAVSNLILDGPWERVDGIAIAESLADLTDGTLDDAIAYDELGGRFQLDAWTGSGEDGLSTGSHCLGWTSHDPGEVGTLGRPWRSENNWTGGSTFACDQPFHLFCLSNRLLLGWDNFEPGDFRHWPVVVGQP